MGAQRSAPRFGRYPSVRRAQRSVSSTALGGFTLPSALNDAWRGAERAAWLR
jgi:hypothetical protein